MNLAKTQYRDYLLSKVDDRQRQAIAHHYGKAPFLSILERLLSEYGLEEELRLARLMLRPKLKILDVGCGEGLYLHDVAELLENRNLPEAALFYGIDIDLPSIETATEYSNFSNPPRPYLNFYCHDLRQPLETEPGLLTKGGASFDLIYARQVLGLIPQAHQNLLQLYAALAPGGALYLDDLIRQEEGWQLPHNALAPLQREANTTILALNEGIDVATATAEWLRQAGATQVQALPYKIVIGGETKVGMEALRSLLMWLRLLSVRLVELGRMGQAEVDQLMQQLYQELSPQCRGHAIYIHTLARKPWA